MTTQQPSQEGPSEPINVGLSPIFDYEELQEATKFFNPSEVIGEGGFGVVYRGKLRDGRAVAIKELNVRHKKRADQFFNEVRLVSQLRHKNLVALYGCTNPEDEKMMLVYEFVPNGTVADHLHHKRFSKKALTWSQRLQIAIETAEALNYLHSFQPPIIHRDVKTDNILLDNNFNVKLADFGLCRLLPTSESRVSTMPQGTQGYLDPEYNQLYKLTMKSDVYSFGVVLMELVSGKAVLDYEERDGDEIWLVNMAFNKLKNNQLERLVDPEVGYLENPNICGTVKSVVQLASECLQPTGSRRPPMVEIIESLKIMEKALFSKVSPQHGTWLVEDLAYVQRERIKRMEHDRQEAAGMNYDESLRSFLNCFSAFLNRVTKSLPCVERLRSLKRKRQMAVGMNYDELVEAIAYTERLRRMEHDRQKGVRINYDDLVEIVAYSGTLRRMEREHQMAAIDRYHLSEYAEKSRIENNREKEKNRLRWAEETRIENNREEEKNRLRYYMLSSHRNKREETFVFQRCYKGPPPI